MWFIFSDVNCTNLIDNFVPMLVLTSTLIVMSTEQDLVKGKDTMVPLVDFQEKKRTGWRQLKISSSGVVQYLSDACYTTIKTLPILCLLIQVILPGDCRWCVCSAFNTKIIARYPGCCGKHDNSLLSVSYFY